MNKYLNKNVTVLLIKIMKYNTKALIKLNIKMEELKLENIMIKEKNKLKKKKEKHIDILKYLEMENYLNNMIIYNSSY